MSEYQILAVIAAFVFLYCLAASRLERTWFSGALVYVACGLILGPFGFELVDLDVDGEALKQIAEFSSRRVKRRKWAERWYLRASTAAVSCLGH